MTQLNYTVPTVGGNNSTEEPLIPTALTAIKSAINGNLDASNLAANSVGASEIDVNAVGTSELQNDSVTSDKVSLNYDTTSTATDHFNITLNVDVASGSSYTIPTNGSYLLFCMGTVRVTAFGSGNSTFTSKLYKNGSEYANTTLELRTDVISGNAYLFPLRHIYLGTWVSGDVFSHYLRTTRAATDIYSGDFKMQFLRIA